MPLGVFYAFAYIVPDFVPPMVQMFVLISTSWSAGRAQSSGTTGGTRIGSQATVTDDYVEPPDGDVPLVSKS